MIWFLFLFMKITCHLMVTLFHLYFLFHALHPSHFGNFKFTFHTHKLNAKYYFFIRITISLLFQANLITITTHSTIKVKIYVNFHISNK